MSSTSPITQAMAQRASNSTSINAGSSAIEGASASDREIDRAADSEIPRESADTRRSREDDIRDRAYQLYSERGGAHGDPMEDWLRAERELDGRSGRSSESKSNEQDGRDSQS